MEKKKIKKTVIIAGYGCNNKCLFCIDEDKRSLSPKKTEEIKREVVSARKDGSSYLELVGGEMTIRKDVVGLVRFAKKQGFDTVMTSTNGRMYAYEDFARKMVEAGIDSIVFSVHGHNARLHDSLTRAPGSFDQLKAGIANLRKAGFDCIGSNTAIVKQNFRHLPEIGKFIAGLGIRNAEFIFVDPTYGGAYNRFDELVPRISEAAPYIRKCLDIGRKTGSRHWQARYVPLCYFQGYEGQISEISEKEKFHTRHWASDFKNEDVEKSRAEAGRVKGKNCRNCKYFDMCEGVWKEYARRYGTEELIPAVD